MCNRKRQIIKCKVENCSQLFEEVTALLKHIRESHGADEVTRFRISEGSYWPIRCTICEHGFTNQSALDKHIEHKDSFRKSYDSCDSLGVIGMSHSCKLLKLNNSELTRCQMFQKNVKKLRKIDKKKLATKPSDERTDVTYHCPIVVEPENV